MWTDKEYHDSRCGENHPMYGKHLSEEWKRKISEGNKGKGRPRLNKEKPIKSNYGHCSLIKCLETGEVFKTAVEAAEKLGMKSAGHIRSVCNGTRKSCGGYHFESIMGNNNS